MKFKQNQFFLLINIVNYLSLPPVEDFASGKV